jgi:hypothetical protein
MNGDFIMQGSTHELTNIDPICKVSLTRFSPAESRGFFKAKLAFDLCYSLHSNSPDAPFSNKFKITQNCQKTTNIECPKKGCKNFFACSSGVKIDRKIRLFPDAKIGRKIRVFSDAKNRIRGGPMQKSNNMGDQGKNRIRGRTKRIFSFNFCNSYLGSL